MLSQRSHGSYAAKAVVERQERMKEGGMASPDRLLTDRTSYIAYLESQLERVSAACLTVQSFDERLEQAVSGIRCLEEKVLNLARLVSCTQQFAEAQEAAARDAAADVGKRLRAVEARLEELEAPGRATEWEAKLRAVSAQADARLAQVEAAAQERLAQVSASLRAGMKEACHASHAALEQKAAEAAGRLSEVERRVRAVDEYAHSADAGAAVADLVARVGSVEGSVAHLAKSDSGMKASLGSLQQAVGQLKTAVVALELRPPVGDAVQGSADCLQWLERAREALKREVCDIQQQHGQLSAGLTSAVAAAAAAPASPQKALAAQVLSGLQSSMQHEVGRELRALQLADSLLGSVASQFRSSPPRPAAAAAAAAGGPCSTAAAAAAAAAAMATCGGGDGDGGEAAAAEGQASGAPAAGAPVCKAPCTQAGDGSPSAGSWTIPAVPAGSQAAYPAAPSSQQVVAAAADGALAQLHQLAGGQAQLAQAAALAAGGGSSLRQTFGQMQQMLKSVCQLLQQEEPEGQQQPQRASEPGYRAPTSCFLTRSSTLRGGSPPGAAGQPKRTWASSVSTTAAPGAARGAGGGTATRSVSFRPGSTGAPAAGGINRSLSVHVGISSGGGAAKEALRESVLGQAALAERRRRLQELYSELRQS